MNYLLVLTLFFFINLIFFLFFDKIQSFINIYDIPDRRKIHKKKISCLGGLLVLISVIFLFTFFKNFLFDAKNLFLNSRHFFSFYLSSILIFFIGLLDDKVNLSPLKKTFLLIFLISISVTLDNTLLIKYMKLSFFENKIIFTDSFSIFFTIFSIFAFLNAFNMFDGIDLQAGLYSLLIFIIFTTKSNYIYIFLPIILSILFFLYFNYKKLLFLGNNGSYLLAYVISWFTIKFYNYEILPSADYIFLFMLVPGLDLIRLTIERLINNKNPLIADTNHIHHILTKKFSENTSKTIIFLSILLPILIQNFTSTLISIIIGIFLYLFLIYFIAKKN